MKLQRISVGLRGSPPQVRGKLCPQTSADGFSGITPAGAGKTGLRVLRPYPPTDHPRRCGENQSSQPHHTGQGGSPPQVRGKRQHPELALLFHGITPAGAGKTITVMRKIIIDKDHPRRCGENRRIVKLGMN